MFWYDSIVLFSMFQMLLLILWESMQTWFFERFGIFCSPFAIFFMRSHDLESSQRHILLGLDRPDDEELKTRGIEDKSVDVLTGIFLISILTAGGGFI